MNTTTQLTEVLTNGKLIPIFEIPVIDKRTNEKDYIVFDIEVIKNNLVAQHVALCQAEEDSDKIANIVREIDVDFSADENLQELYKDCTTKIMDSEWFELSE